MEVPLLVFLIALNAVFAMADRLHSEVDQVGSAEQFDDREQHDRLRDDRTHAERNRCDERQRAEPVPEHTHQTAAPPVGERPADHEEHARPRNHDEDHRG